jgi:hypothetical protein
MFKKDKKFISTCRNWSQLLFKIIYEKSFKRSSSTLKDYNFEQENLNAFLEYKKLNKLK